MNSFKNAEIDSFGLQVWSGSVNTPHSPHRHNEIELNAIEAGSLTYLLAGQQILVSPGEIALFWGAIPHQVIHYAPNTQVHWGTIPLDHVLRWELPHTFLLALLAGTMFRDRDPLYDARFFRQWQTDLSEGHATLALLEIKALFFRFTRLVQDKYRPAGTAEDRVNQMAWYMSQHFQEPITIAEIAAQIGLHPTYAMHLFKETFGMSLITYLTQQRIAHAQQLLIMTDGAVSDVALEAGFPNLSHFYTAFNRLCGMSPGKYRASLRK
ncbi:MAG: helix-turn-helix domain-containing protein [Anaerolineae bacterium]|nr:helix-turn-helix domain-containing protein [Anaerolineae bacterium]